MEVVEVLLMHMEVEEVDEVGIGFVDTR